VPRARSRWLLGGKPLGTWSGGNGPYLQRARSERSSRDAIRQRIEANQRRKRFTASAIQCRALAKDYLDAGDFVTLSTQCREGTGGLFSDGDVPLVFRLNDVRRYNDPANIGSRLSKGICNKLSLFRARMHVIQPEWPV
jgi:hypothetical protein